MSTNYEDAIEIIGQRVYKLLDSDDPDNDEALKNVTSLLNCVEDGYCLIQWPESQEYMEEEWFNDEAILDVNNPSAYFIPIKRLV